MALDALKSFAMRWWLREPRTPLNLMAPDVLCELSIHILPNGDRKMYCSKLPQEIPVQTLGMIALGVTGCGLDFIGQYAKHLPPDALGWVTTNVVQQGIGFGKQHGITLQFSQEKK